MQFRYFTGTKIIWQWALKLHKEPCPVIDYSSSSNHLIYKNVTSNHYDTNGETISWYCIICTLGGSLV